MNTNPTMLVFIKAIAHVDRLRIIGLLTTQRLASRADIVAKLRLPLREVVDHLAFLEQVGAIQQKEDVYELNTDKLAVLGRDQFEHVRATYIPVPELDQSHRKF